jgi:Tol biopolymer transport system component
VVWGLHLNRWLAFGVGAALLVLVMLLAGPPAQATFPGRPGLIAFNSNGRIWTIDPSTPGSAKELATGVEPGFSPNGELIAFVKSRKLLVMRTDGSGERIVFEDAPGNYVDDPAFSPDGKTIFFSRDTGKEGYSDIWSIPLAGGEPRRLTFTGGHETEVAAEFPEVAPNGRFVVFQRDGATMTMRPDGSRLKKLTKGLDPSVSPDSRQVVVQRYEKLAIIGAGGGHERILDLYPKKYPGELIREAASPTFSPDGKSIVFTYRRTVDAGPHLNVSNRLMIYSLKTHKITQLTNAEIGGSNPDWAPAR